MIMTSFTIKYFHRSCTIKKQKGYWSFKMGPIYVAWMNSDRYKKMICNEINLRVIYKYGEYHND